MKRPILLTLLLSSVLFAHPQDKPYDRPFSIYLGYNKSSYSNTVKLKFEPTYRVHLCLTVGGYVGFESFQPGLSIFSYKYGASLGFHPLALLFDDKKPRFDLFLKTRVGGLNYLKWLSLPKSHFFDYGISPVLQYYPFKHMGVFVEYSIPIQPYAPKDFLHNIMYGVVLKF